MFSLLRQKNNVVVVVAYSYWMDVVSGPTNINKSNCAAAVSVDCLAYRMENVIIDV